MVNTLDTMVVVLLIGTCIAFVAMVQVVLSGHLLTQSGSNSVITAYFMACKS